MSEAFIVDYVRTPIGRLSGSLVSVRPDDLLAHVLRTLGSRHQFLLEETNEVIAGCANQAGEDNRNVARMAVLLAGFNESVAGVTVNRLCASGLEAVNQAARLIRTGEADIVVAGGVESMSRAPYVLPKPELETKRGSRTMYDTTLGWRMANEAFPYPLESMGETAENVAVKYGISRTDQDDFAYRSQHLAAEAQASGWFEGEITPLEVTDKRTVLRVEQDENIRAGVTLEGLAKLKPAFRTGGTVTAGNASSLNDGAAAMLLMSEKAMKWYELSPVARYVGSAAVGVDPCHMGIGPVAATERLLARHGLETSELSAIELNEAFASQALACIRELNFPVDRVNSHGGAIALGHPLGCSGTRIVGTLARQLNQNGGRFGLATLCVGVGQGVATLIENCRY